MGFREGLAMSLRRAYLAMHRRFQAHFFAGFAVTADQFVVLTLLAEEDGIIQQELVERTCSDPNTITALLRLLEKRGLIDRVRDEHDGRARRVRLTRKGRRLQERLADSSAAIHQQLSDAVPPADGETLLDNLQRIADAMKPAQRRASKSRRSGRPA